VNSAFAAGQRAQGENQQGAPFHAATPARDFFRAASRIAWAALSREHKRFAIEPGERNAGAFLPARGLLRGDPHTFARGAAEQARKLTPPPR